MNINFTLHITIQYYIFYCVAQIIPSLAIANSFRLTAVSFWCISISLFLNTSLFYSIAWCSRLILYFSCLSSSISHFLKDPWFLLKRIVQRNQNLGFVHAHYYKSLTVSRDSQHTELALYTYRDRVTEIDVYTHIYV